MILYPRNLKQGNICFMCTDNQTERYNVDSLGRQTHEHVFDLTNHVHI